jgi:predicted negative regulator of RcsB-dependent stress response
MSQIPSIRSIREAILEQSRPGAADAVALMTLQQDVEECIRGIRRAIDRVADFAERGLYSEASSVIEDFPDLLKQAEALRTLPSSDPMVAQVWNQHLASLAERFSLPMQAEVDGLASITMRAQEHRPLLDALRISALRREPLTARLRILRRLRAADQYNRMWLDQIESLETARLKQLADLRHAPGVSREELEEALAALESREWIAVIPRGLREELIARVMPMRAEAAGERYTALARQIHDAAALMDREELVRLEADWAKTNLETGRMPDPTLAETVQPAFRWLNNLEVEERERAAHDAEIARLEQMLATDASIEEIERQGDALRRSRRGAPDDLLHRADTVVSMKRAAARRRRQIMVASIVCGVILIGIGTLLAVRMTQASEQRGQQIAALDAAVEAKRLDEVERIAAELRASGLDSNSAVTAALERADAFVQGQAKLASDAKRALASIEAELGQSEDRTRIVAMKDKIGLARANADKEDQEKFDELERRRVDRLRTLDQQADASSSAALEKARQSLQPWKPIAAWTGAAQTDPGELKRYMEALQATREQLASIGRNAGGPESKSTALQAEMTTIDGQIEVVRGRLDALSAALQDLDPARLCTPVVNEAEFIARLDAVMSKHGEVLSRSGRLPVYEEAVRATSAWKAIQAWREEFQPQLAAFLGPGLDGEPPASAEAQVVQVINAYLARHPASPYAKPLKAIESRYASNRTADLWPLERVSEQLDAARLADLEQVPLRSGGWFYRRPQAGVDPRNRAVENLKDLLGKPEQLDSILSVKPDDITGKPVPNEVSLVWAESMRRIANGSSASVGNELVKLLATTAGSSSDVLLRLRALRDASELLANSGYMPGPLAQPLNAWRESLDSSAKNALVADWLRAGFEPEINFRAARIEATKAISRFPDVQRLLADAAKKQSEAALRLRPAAPWGVVEPQPNKSAPRAVIGRSEPGRFQAILRTGAEWELIEVTVEGGMVTHTAGLFEGPILLFKPSGS